MDLPEISGVLTASEIERAFQRERSRVDRNGQSFAVVVFHVQEKRNGDFVRVARVLMERVRDYDDVGLVAQGRLAVLLPEAEGAGAWTFADQAVQQLAEANLAVDVEVFTYPHQPDATGDDDDDRESKGMVRLVRDDESSDDEGLVSAVEFEGTSARARTKEHAPRPSMQISLEHAKPTHLPGPRQLHAVSEAANRAPTPVRAPRLVAAPRQVRDLAELFEEPLPPLRRLVDIVVVSIAILVLSPLLIATAIAVKVTSPGPIIYWQWRAGRGGRPFRFYKFRSMRQNADEEKKALRLVNEQDGPIFKIKDDPRVTPVGKIIRALSIDELPQLFNVLKGDMTLVGPRPPVLDEVAGYEPWQKQRLDVTGGITCIWQVSGRSDVGFRDWMRMDVRYRKTRTLGLDLRLMLRTFGAVLSRKGAY